MGRIFIEDDIDLQHNYYCIHCFKRKEYIKISDRTNLIKSDCRFSDGIYYLFKTCKNIEVSRNDCRGFLFTNDIFSFILLEIDEQGTDIFNCIECPFCKNILGWYCQKSIHKLFSDVHFIDIEMMV